MPWHVIGQIGEDDYYPSLDDGEPRFVATIDKPGSAHSVTQHLLMPVFKAGLQPSQTAIDLLHLAVLVYTADLRVWRGYSKEDAWTRDISLYLPVTDVDLWTGARQTLIDLLSFLTGDTWDIHFRSKVPASDQAMGKPRLLQPDAVCLFSGGLDSFAGAIDLLASGKRLALVGHYGNSQREQEAAFKALKAVYDAQILPLWFYLVPPTMAKKQQVESTMRARSILFLSLGAAVASSLPLGSPLYIPENGFISLNIPLTFGRTGTHSTRTTHPYTIDLFRRLLTTLGIPIALNTPYRFKTKGEMLRECKDQVVLKEGIHSTMSCSRPQSGRFHGLPVGQPCGYCVPCIIRRASLNVVGLDSEPTNKDVLLPSIRANEAAGCDKRAFLMAISRVQQMSSLEITAEILSAGPVDPAELEGLQAVFRRGLDEVKQFLGRKA
jgi:7-cyano-7-deazaguanine synthase in queuosine biosynthesis